MKERVLEGLAPERVFYYFEEISQIPRPSGNEKAISDYLKDFARAHGFSCVQDEAYNIIMTKPAAAGYEDKESIILQGHMDMVCEKIPGSKTDMEKEGLRLFVDGDLVGAHETTLGGDDGIAVAMVLALFEDENLPAPELVFVCTTSEETGMVGAEALDLSQIKSRRLINIDSEKEGELVCGCAGGGRIRISLPIKREESDGIIRQIAADGLLGGHSGTEIDKGRANANMLIARVLRRILQEYPIRLCSFSGGEKDNVIPSKSVASIMLKKEDEGAIEKLVAKEEESIKRVYGDADPGIKITFSDANPGALKEEHPVPLSFEDTKRVILLMLSLPNGIVRMSKKLEGLVETSLNLGVLLLQEEKFDLAYLLRSSVEAAYLALRENMRFVAEGFGADAEISSEYPAWEYNPNSALCDRLSALYEKRTG